MQKLYFFNENLDITGITIIEKVSCLSNLEYEKYILLGTLTNSILLFNFEKKSIDFKLENIHHSKVFMITSAYQDQYFASCGDDSFIKIYEMSHQNKFINLYSIEDTGQSFIRMISFMDLDNFSAKGPLGISIFIDGKYSDILGEKINLNSSFMKFINFEIFTLSSKNIFSIVNIH